MELNYTVLLKGFLDGEGKLRQFPSKMKAKVPAMYYIASKFEMGKQYSEPEVNSLINSACAFRDPATIRRDMVDNKFLDRSADCRAYKLAGSLPKYPELGIE